MYMAEVIAFFRDGRFNWMRKMFSERSVRMSLMILISYAATAVGFDAGEVRLAIKSPGSNRRSPCAENLGNTGMNPSSASSIAPSSKSIR
jgi:hypothetical protein